MNSFIAASMAEQHRFNTMVTNLGMVAKSHDLVMNDQLEVIDKRGWGWRFLCLWRPFYCLFCGDVYSHVRVNNVTTAILKACALNKTFLKTNLPLRAALMEGIHGLDKKTKGKYASCIQQLETDITAQIADRVVSPPTATSSHIVASEADSSHDAPASPSHVRARSSYHLTSPLRVDVLSADANEFQLHWPSDQDFELCGISKEHITELTKAIDTLVAQCFDSPGSKLHFVKQGDKRTLQLIGSDENVLTEMPVPISLEVVYKDDQLQDILLLTKFVIAVGGETKVRLCFSLAHGAQLVRKNCFGKLQEQLLRHFQISQPRGIVPIYGIRKSQTANGEKIQSMEAFRLGNLREFITNQPMPPFEKRLEIAMDALHGVAAIHGVKCDQYEMSDGTSTAPFNLSHLDLSPSNLLLNQDPDTSTLQDTALTDFGCAHPENVGGTPGFKAPEMIHLCRNYAEMNRADIAAHNIKYGQSSDIWSIGLVFVALFTWKVDPLGGAPLPCIVDSLNKARKPGNSIDVDENIMHIPQRQIDDDISKLRFECLAQGGSAKIKIGMNTVWDMISQMVRTEPGQRITVEAALKMLRSIKLH